VLVVVVTVVVVVLVVLVVLVVVVVVVVETQAVPSASSSSHSPSPSGPLQHVKYCGSSRPGLLPSKSVLSFGAHTARRSVHWRLRHARWHFGSASTLLPQLRWQRV
jgi:hypothetical protein